MSSDADFVVSGNDSNAEPTPVTDASSSITIAPAVRSTQYYLEPVTFRVEGTLYKVPQHRFKNESVVFNGMYSLPQHADAEGCSDEKPIDLIGIKEVDFLRFLKVVEPLHNDGPSGTYEDWTSVLKLATMWGFKGIRNLAIERMNPLLTGLKATDKIVLAYEYGIQTWFLDGMNELVKASDFVPESEWIELGWSLKWIFRLVSAREACHTAGHRQKYTGTCSHGYTSGSCTWGCPKVRSPGSCNTTHLDGMKIAFADELKDMDYSENAWTDSDDVQAVKPGGAKGKK